MSTAHNLGNKMITAIGKHKVKLGDVMNGVDDLMAGELADLIYTDPPWGSGNIKYWETMRLKMNGIDKSQRVEREYKGFLDTIFGICKQYAKNIVVLEYGQTWRKDILDLAQSFGFQNLLTVETFYSSQNLPLDLHILAKTPVALPPGYAESIYHTKGFKTLEAAAAPFIKEGGTVLDPCCGMGYSAQLAVNNKMVFRGNEMNAKRLQKTIERLNKDV